MFKQMADKLLDLAGDSGVVTITDDGTVYAQNYESIGMIARYVQYAIALAIAVISVRCVYMIVHMFSSAEEGISAAAIFAKTQNHVKSLVILVSVEALIGLLMKYLF